MRGLEGEPPSEIEQLRREVAALRFKVAATARR
jgi:hypothetical protein